MAFPFFRKKQKEDKNEMTTLEQVRKAYEDLSDDDKKSFSQSIADRVHESIGEQEHDDGDKDSQSAADREHEALGAEHADGEGDTAELHETDKPEEKSEDKDEDAHEERQDDGMKAILARLDALEARFKDDGDSDKEATEKAEKVYGLHSGVFASDADASEKITPKEAAQIARAFRN